MIYCNAGFDIIGNSLENYVGSPIINLTVMGLIILGGIGFTVIIDVLRTKKIKSFSLHTKLVLLMTGSLILSGFVFFFLLEYNNVTLNGLSLPDKMLAAMFQSVTPRTAGFNTIPTGALRDSSKFLTIIYMFIGGSPGSTAGGIKTATFGVFIFAIYVEIIGKDDVEFAKRRISTETVSRSLAILMIALTIVSVVAIILSLTESGFEFLDILFETVSAFGTVGLSTGVTGNLSTVGKIIISITMFLGRLGPITVATAIAERHTGQKALIKYPEGKIFVG
jgi:trk system potassium uptake protein TrkH